MLNSRAPRVARRTVMTVAVLVLLSVLAFGRGATPAGATPLAAQDAPSVAASTLSPGAGGFVPITPYRLVDTRVPGNPVSGNPYYGSPAMTARQTRIFKVDAPNAGALALNVTAVGPSAPGFLTVWPGDQAQPTSSVLNYSPGQTVPNAVTVQLAADGTIKVYSWSATNLIIDVMGYYQKTSGAPGGGGFQGIQPVRLLDSRQAWSGYSGPLTGGTSRHLNVVSPASVPDNAVAVVLNVTATNDGVAGASGGYLTVYPTGTATPTASNLNYTGGGAVANQVTVQVGAGGSVDLYAISTTQVVVDIMGWYAPGAPVPGGFVSFSPKRLMDTRTPEGDFLYDPNTDSVILAVGGSAASGVPANAGAASLNVTIDQPEGPGFVTVWPDGTTRPTASNLNHADAQTVPNAVTVGLGATSGVGIYASAVVVDVIVDINGYYTSPYV